MERVDKVERQADLVALLLATPRPLRLREIVSQVVGYPDGEGAARQAFERDKRELRAEGIPVATVPVDGGELGYRIPPEDYELADLGLTEEESIALALAVAAVRLEGTPAEEALWKLGGASGAPPPVVVLPSLPALPGLREAAARRSTVRFRYGGVDREVEPWGLLSRDAFWYLVGWDRTRSDRRTFRVDRIEGGVEAGPPGAFDRPADLDLAEALGEPWEIGQEEAAEALVLVDAVHAGRVARELGEAAVVERRPDGSVVVRLTATNRAGLRSWVLGMLTHARLLGPPDLVDDVVGWLQSVAATGGEA